MDKERTLILIKPDSVKRHLAGKIISRFEETGLKITGMKMVWADENLAKNHYKMDEEWTKALYEKTVKAYEKEGKKPDFKDHVELGNRIQSWNINFLREGPVIAIVFEGFHAIELARKMIGATEPRQAAPGTIRGDLASTESYVVVDSMKRVLRNLVHASDSVKNAEREIALWFKPSELHKHKTNADLS